ncbi:hypothetical protein HER10_EVM0000647 [Colletotrichum scovillei]|uniref:C6 zinc finger domain-containing protein n=1 Tax=Colletotrichum scovillei TaxID=1209932 RepID=A0A9P7UKW3_9PEZI|nr:uncharacterized protein HER10_EVM0000647 [Colletotrichum scovillei]KAF4772846.1 hypothetical protein HER10_EVM0000647 [Colletotrichum scovillei]KAG7054520.1 C6 zinc finger domain-containing protein [Colletotrichum scovillei]KAG7073964.1 C6 zinc finger domain-containing protein [Colletotrichum scovillei]KAG7081106.1 C6 zinc finger domain-containing protein [Colletotrichum scovillei]
MDGVQSRPQPPRGANKSKSRPTIRVKSGCKTCRIRKVKCDETRPACRRCVTTGRTCDEYGIWSSRTRSPAPFMSQQASSISLRNIRTSVSGLSDAEKRLYEWFSRRTIAKLAGIFDSAFWDTIVLQTSSREPAVMHAILALASVHKHQMTDAASVPNQLVSPSLDVQERSTLQHYNKSIVLLRERLALNNPMSAQVALVSCILYICLEYMRKRFKAGHSHLNHGLNLLSHIIPDLKSGDGIGDARCHKALDPMVECLIDTLSQLYYQARSLKGPFSQERQSDGLRPLGQLPGSFGSLIEARNHLDQLLVRAQRLRRCCLASATSPDVSQAFEMLVIQSCLRNDLISWSLAFNLLKTKRWTHLSARERLPFRLLPVYHTMAHIIMETSLHPDDELIFDKFIWHFDMMVESSKEILTAAIPTIAADLSSGHCTTKFSFTADMGLIPPLYYVALKCRKPSTRRQAVGLITGGLHQEGMWDATLAGTVASEVMRMEEGDFYERVSSGNQVLRSKGLAGERPTPQTLPNDRRLLNVRLLLPDDSLGELAFSGTMRCPDGTLKPFKKVYDAKNRNWTFAGVR